MKLFALSITILLARAGAEIGPHLLDGTDAPTFHRDIAQSTVSIEDLLTPFAGKKTGLAFRVQEEEGKFVWEDGCTSSYTNWDAGPPQEPNNDPNYRGEDCTIKWNDGTVWNDVPCDFTYPCYCQAVKGGGTR